MFHILSIHGGGIRGIIPALILAEIEQRTGKAIHELFDLIAGTSTGGILALALTKSDGRGRAAYSASSLVDLYANKGDRIFSRSVWQRVRAVGNLAEGKYPSDDIEEVLEEHFGKTHLKTALTPVLVTAYDIERRQSYFFKSHRAANDPDQDFLMRDDARATSAAPTYFEPARVQPVGDGEGRALVDEGVLANNPAACALVEAIADFDEVPENIAMLSLGTGEHTRSIPYEEAKGWGLARWAQPILNVVFDGVSDTVNYQVNAILGTHDGGGRCLRIQTQLHEGNDDMDDASKTNIKVLRLIAQELIQRHSSELDGW